MLINTIKIMIFTVFLSISTVSDAASVIKLATVAPKDSIWHEHLKKIYLQQ